MEVRPSVEVVLVCDVGVEVCFFVFDVATGNDTMVVRWAMREGIWAVGEACGRVSSRRVISRIWARERAVGGRLRRYCGEGEERITVILALDGSE